MGVESVRTKSKRAIGQREYRFKRLSEEYDIRQYREWTGFGWSKWKDENPDFRKIAMENIKKKRKRR